MRTSRKKFEIRASRVRAAIKKNSNRFRLSVSKSGRHISAQIIDDQKSVTLVGASSLELRKDGSKKNFCNKDHAAKVGEMIAERAAKAGIKEVVFDKGGNKYHGVVATLADSARSKLEF